MRILYGVLCHRNTKVLRKTIEILSKSNIILIHVDKKTNIDEFAEYKKNENVILLSKREYVRWGEFSQIKSMINILEYSKKYDYDYLSFISGDCLIIKNDIEIKNILNRNRGKEFIGIDKKIDRKAIEDRVKFLYPEWRFDKECLDTKLFLKIKRYIQIKFNIFKRNKSYNKLPTLYKGSNWFTISKNLVDYILNFIKENEGYLNAYKYSLCCDEVFFQTIVMNSKYKKNIYNLDSENEDNLMSLRYIDWSSGPEYPKVLNVEDLKYLKSTECIIARKFSEDIDFGEYDKFIDNI